MLLGTDISHWQGAPDFGAIRNAGISFVLAKATESTTFADPSYLANRNGTHAAGLTFGAYHFARATDPVAEATFFCDHVGPLNAGELVALDWEVPGSNPPAWCKTWLDTVQSRLGVKPLIYMNKSAEAGSDWTPVVQGDYGLWLANYDFDSANPAPVLHHWTTVAIEQYSDRAVISGLAGGVDADVFYGDAAALAKYTKQGTPTPVPPPPPAPSFNVTAWRAQKGDVSPHIQNLQVWFNKNYPAYSHISPTAQTYGPQTVAVVREFAHRSGIPSADGLNIGPQIAAALAKAGFGG